MANAPERPNTIQTKLTTITILVAIPCLLSAFGLIFAGTSLDSRQRWLLSLFLVIFPTAGLYFAVRLISRQYRKLISASTDKGFSWASMTAEQQRLKLNLEIMMIADTMRVSAEQNGELRAAYIVAEDLAMRRIELEDQLPLMRHIVLEGVPFDAIATKEDKLFCVEVMFLVEPELSAERINAVFDKLELAAQSLALSRPDLTPELILALVTQLTANQEKQLRDSIGAKLSYIPVDIDIRFMDFENLQTAFTAE